MDQEERRLLATLEQLLAIEATEVKAALDQVCQLAAEALGADKVDIFLHEPTVDTLVAMGTSDTPMARRERAIGMDRLPIANRGRTVEVFQTGTAYRSGYADQDPSELVGVKQGLGVRSALAVPLEISGERRGVLSITSAQPERFSEGDQRFSEAVARWVGMVLHRAELVERIAQDAAEQARRVAAEELLVVLAHDLRNYLTPLTSRIDMIRRRAQRESRERDVRDAAAAAQGLDRFRRLIMDLLDIGRLEQGLFTLSVSLEDMSALVQETVNALRTPGVAIHVYAPDELCVEIDADRVRQALENLLSNALKHSPAGVPITLQVQTEIHESRQWAVLSVRDEGPGIAPELLPRLFDRFAFGPESTGLGLGLYLARGIAQAHGGSLTVDSTVGTGTTFRLMLPMPQDR